MPSYIDRNLQWLILNSLAVLFTRSWYNSFTNAL